MITIGIDVSKDKLDCSLLKQREPLKVKTKVFKNNSHDHEKLIEWSLTNTKQAIGDIHFVMEATGVYHEGLAYYLHEAGAKVSIVNPAHVHNYAKSLGKRTKSDKKDSVVISRYAATHPLQAWEPEPVEIRQLQSLLRRYESINKDIIRENNRLEKSELVRDAQPVVDSIQIVLTELDKEKKRLEKLIDDHIDSHPQLKRDKQLLTSIPGVGEIVSKYMMVLIRGHQFKSAKQCSAFVGLNPVLYESGSSVRGRAHLSKAGDSIIRSKLYLAAVVATQYNPDIKFQYTRLLTSGKTKMSALGAAMRKLVQICFGVLKHQTQYQSQTL